jgi:hypothetical protein
MSHAAEGRHADPADEDRATSVARIAGGTLLVVAVVAVVSGVYLQPFLDDPARSPHGVETPGSIQRTLLVSELGPNELETQPAHPVVTSVLRDVGGGGPLDLGRVWPAIFTVAIALAGAGLGTGVAGERRWVGATLGVGIAASPFVALSAIGSAPDLLADLLAVAAVAVAVRVRSGGRGAIALILLIGAAAIGHRVFGALLVALLGAYAAGVTVATWWRRRRDDGARWRDPRRLLLAVGLGAVLSAVLLLASPGRPDRIPSTRRAVTDGTIEAQLPQMALGATIPLAVVGGAVMWASRRPATTRVLPPLALWALAAPAGLIAWRVFDTTMPLRIVPLALGVPALIVLGAGATRAWTDAMDGRPDRATWVRAGAIASAVLVVAATAWLTVRGAGAWTDAERGFTEEQFEQASILAAYAETLPPGTRIVVPMKPGERRPLSALMITLPIERFLDVEPWRVDFAGDRARFRERLAARYPDAVAVHLEGYSDQPPLGGRRLGPGVRLLAGPAPPDALRVRPAAPSGAGDLLRLTVASIATLLVVGLGWAIALTGFPTFVVVCISPALGVAMLAMGGFVAGRFGVPLGGGGGVLVAMAVALLGGLAVLIERRRSDGPDEPEPQPALASPLWLAPMGGRHLAGDRGVRSE